MKKAIKYIAILFATSCLISACSGAADEVYGEALIYMPQAVSNLTGPQNQDSVKLSPLGGDTTILVGVYRSGLQKLSAFSVDLVVDTDTLEKAIALSASDDDYKQYANAKLLPAQYYELPAKISVKSGDRNSWTDILIKKEQLLNNWEGSSTTYILPVRIVNPTQHELNEDLSLTMFIFKKK